MYQRIIEGLQRQSRALDLLSSLLEEEYSVLMQRDTDAVVHLEFSIQELIRQLAVEKSCIIRSLNGMRVSEYAEIIAEELAAPLREVFAAVDTGEQRASRQASRNAQLSLALLDQSSRTLQALSSQATPARATTYGRRGYMQVQGHPQAAIISGRL